MTERYGCDEWWESYPGASNYQFSAAGRVRSVDRTIGGTFYRGQLLSTRPGNRPREAPPERRYRLTDIRMDDGTRKTVSVHTGVLLSHTGGRPDGMQACHGDDHPGHNWWANLRWDDPESNRVDRYGEHVRKVASDASVTHRGGGGWPSRSPDDSSLSVRTPSSGTITQRGA